MRPYGTAHLVMLGLGTAGLGPALWLGRRDRDRAATGVPIASRMFGLAILVFAVPLHLADLLTNFELGVSLPLQLSDLAWMAAAAALWTSHRIPVALTFYWGLVLTPQAILTPSLAEDFPALRFFGFWGTHLLTVWAAVYLVWGLRFTPAWRDYAATLATTLVWAAAVLGFNSAAGTNYGYLLRKPSAGSVLDYLGPWPWYLLAEAAIVAAVWALMTWPWARRRPA